MSTAATPAPATRSDDLVPDPVPPSAPGTPISSELIKEMEDFVVDCQRRCTFNSRWDNALNVCGILLSVLIIAAGVFKQSELSAILGGLVAAIVTAQRAFPFNQRMTFYRMLMGQAQNLVMEARNGVLALDPAIRTMKTLRLDFAQQLPRGSTFRNDPGAVGGGAVGGQS
jgi:hypothetical protein